jgi:hypothetical protein
MKRRRYWQTTLVFIGITLLAYYLIKLRPETVRITMKYAIEHLWNSRLITEHRPIEISLSSSTHRDHLLIEIDATFFNDDAPASVSLTRGPYPQLWNYEVVELFFLASSSNHYLELEFSPHGHYLVLLLTDRRKELKQMLPISDYRVERRSSDRWIARASVSRSLFPARVDRFNARTRTESYVRVALSGATGQ